MPACMRMNAHARACAHAHSHTHACSNTCSHAHAQVHAHVCSVSLSHTHTHLIPPLTQAAGVCFYSYSKREKDVCILMLKQSNSRSMKGKRGNMWTLPGWFLAKPPVAGVARSAEPASDKPLDLTFCAFSTPVPALARLLPCPPGCPREQKVKAHSREGRGSGAASGDMWTLPGLHFLVLG